MNSCVEPLFEPIASESNFLMASPFIIYRALEVRSVYNSPSELRLSLDIPGAARESLDVSLERTESDGNNPDTSSVSVKGTRNGEYFSKTLDLPSKALDLTRARASLANGVLEIIAPKSQGIAGSVNTRIPVL